jgi:Tfp pilus assembly protein PilF
MEDLLNQKLKLIKKLNDGLWGYPNESGHLEKAEDILTDLLLRFPENTLVLTNMGALLCDQGKYEEAMIHLEKAECIGTSDRNLYLNIGVAMMNISAQTRKKAPDYFKKAKDFDEAEFSLAAYFDPQGY